MTHYVAIPDTRVHPQLAKQTVEVPGQPETVHPLQLKNRTRVRYRWYNCSLDDSDFDLGEV